MLQVETVAQFGVVFLLFALGLEFSLAKVCWVLELHIVLLENCKGLYSNSSSEGENENTLFVRKHFNFSLMQLKVVGPVAVLGGLLQILTFMFLCGIIAAV